MWSPPKSFEGDNVDQKPRQLHKALLTRLPFALPRTNFASYCLTIRRLPTQQKLPTQTKVME